MTASRPFVALLMAGMLLSCDAPTASRPTPAYDPTVLTFGLHYRWPSGTHVRIAVATSAANLPAGSDLSGAVDRAIAAWNDVPQFGEFMLERASGPTAADVLIYDQVTAAPAQPSICAFTPGGSSGYTYFCPPVLPVPSNAEPPTVLPLALTSGGGTVSVLIRVDRGRVTSTAAYDAVVAHEIGHALGIGAHSGSAEDVMYGAPVISKPSARDKATLRAVLGAVPDFRL